MVDCECPQTVASGRESSYLLPSRRRHFCFRLRFFVSINEYPKTSMWKHLPRMTGVKRCGSPTSPPDCLIWRAGHLRATARTRD